MALVKEEKFLLINKAISNWQHQITNIEKENEKIIVDINFLVNKMANLKETKITKNWQLILLNIVTFGTFKYLKKKIRSKKIATLEEKIANLQTINSKNNEAIVFLKATIKSFKRNISFFKKTITYYERNINHFDKAESTQVQIIINEKMKSIVQKLVNLKKEITKKMAAIYSNTQSKKQFVAKNSLVKEFASTDSVDSGLGGEDGTLALGSQPAEPNTKVIKESESETEDDNKLSSYKEFARTASVVGDEVGTLVLGSQPAEPNIDVIAESESDIEVITEPESETEDDKLFSSFKEFARTASVVGDEVGTLVLGSQPAEPNIDVIAESESDIEVITEPEEDKKNFFSPTIFNYEFTEGLISNIEQKTFNICCKVA